MNSTRVPSIALLLILAACGGEPPPVTPAASPSTTAPASAVPAAITTSPAGMTAMPAPEPAPVASASAAPAAVSSAAPAARPPLNLTLSATRGQAVFYDANGRGSCALHFGHGDAVMSVPPSIYEHVQGCGACFEVKGPVGTAVIEAVDLCPSCPDSDVVINKPAFEQVAGKAVGKADVTWKKVPCAVQGNLEFRIKESSSQYWTAIQIRNHRLPIRGVAFKRYSDWIEMKRSADNYFVAEKGVGTDAITLRVTADDGQQIEETIAAKWKDGQAYPGVAQFK